MNYSKKRIGEKDICTRTSCDYKYQNALRQAIVFSIFLFLAARVLGTNMAQNKHGFPNSWRAFLAIVFQIFSKFEIQFNLNIVIIIRFCMEDELNGQALHVHHTKPYKNYNFQNDGTSRYFSLWLWKLVRLLNLACSFQGLGVFYSWVWSNCSRAAVPWQRSIISLVLALWVCFPSFTKQRHLIPICGSLLTAMPEAMSPVFLSSGPQWVWKYNEPITKRN